jgi:hypothetical protein
MLVALASCSHPSTSPAPAPSPRCPSTPISASTQADVDALRGCTTLAGLTLHGAVAFDLTPLAGLTRIDGDLTARGTFALGSIQLPALTHLTGALTVTTNLDLAGLYLPALTTAASVTIADDPSLIEVMLPALATVGGDVRFARLASLELVDLTALVPPPTATYSVEAAPRAETWLGPAPAGRSQP